MRTLTVLLVASLFAPPVFAQDGPPGPGAAEREQQLLAQVRENDECRYEKLLELRERNPQAYHRALEEVARHFQEMRGNPKVQQLEADMKAVEAQIRSRALALKHADSDKEARRLEGELEELLGQMFDLRSEMQRMRIDQMSERLAGLEEELANREENRDQFIEERMERMPPSGP